LRGGLPVLFFQVVTVLGDAPMQRCPGSLQELLLVLLPDAWSLQELLVLVLLPDEPLLAYSCGLLICCWCSWLLKPDQKGTGEGRKGSFRRKNKREPDWKQ
jgi:hypothetical protein